LPPGCSLPEFYAGLCPESEGEIVDGGVQIGAETTVGGSNGSGNGGGGSGSSAPPADSSGPPGLRLTDRSYTVTGPVTLSDLVNFRPAPGVDSMEPDGWMIVGLDTNFYA